MRRPLSLLLLGAAALSMVAAGPAPAPEADTDDIIVCVRFRDWEIPMTGITVEKPARRFCVESGEIPGHQQ